MNFMLSAFQTILSITLQTAEDVIYLIPYFFLTYLLLEYLEHKTHSKIRKIIQKTNRFGPFWGAFAGIMSGCGFAAVAANFYLTRVITFGTLIAVYLASSDEMLPLMISQGVAGKTIVQIIAFKIIFAVFIGFLIDFYHHRKKQPLAFKALCRQANCHCEENTVLKSTLIHTLQLTVFVFGICFMLNAVFYFVPLERISLLFATHETSAVFIAALIGLIPNCGVSIALTQLYIQGVLSVSPLIAGLLSGGGVGLIVLYKLKPDVKELIKIGGILFICGVIGGHIAGLLF